MNIEVREAGKSRKYYLAHSFREGKRVIKIRRYLGTNLSKAEIEKLRIRAEDIIRQQIQSYKLIADPLKHKLSNRELSLVKKLEASIDINVKHLSKQDWQLFTELFTYNTNAIEGSEVNFNEVKNILEENHWPQDVKKEDISETYGVAQAIEFIRKNKDHVSIALIKKLHLIVFRNSKQFAGKLRPKGIEVVIRDGLGNIVHVGAPSNRIIGLLQELVEWYNLNKNKLPGLVLAAVVHNQFENIHPFEDGNGRVGRLLMNNILLKHKLPPVNIDFNNRREYYNSLQAYEKKGDLMQTLKLILKEYKSFKKQLGAYKSKKM